MSTELIESTCTIENNDIGVAQLTMVVDSKIDQPILSYICTSSGVHKKFSDALYSDVTEKLKLSINALKNLFKKYDFLQLNYQLETNQINIDEFNEEITKNEYKYFIDQPTREPSFKQLQIIDSILKEIDKDKEMFIDDVQDLFDLEINKYISELSVSEGK